MSEHEHRWTVACQAFGCPEKRTVGKYTEKAIPSLIIVADLERQLAAANERAEKAERERDEKQDRIDGYACDLDHAEEQRDLAIAREARLREALRYASAHCKWMLGGFGTDRDEWLPAARHGITHIDAALAADNTEAEAMVRVVEMAQVAVDCEHESPEFICDDCYGQLCAALDATQRAQQEGEQG